MDITTFSQNLHQRIREMDTAAADDLTTIGKAVATLKHIMQELKEFTRNYSFENDQEEIIFFKETKPVLMSQYLYYRRKFDILLLDSFQDTETRLKKYYIMLRRLRRFAARHKSFYEYCLSGASYADVQYFTRHSRYNMAINADENFSTGYDVILARILAHELIKNLVQEAIRKMENGSKDKLTNPLQWTTQKVALVELIYALHASGVFNHGKSELKQIVECFEQMFAIDLGNYARVFSEIKIRKKGQTNFIDQMRTRLSEVIEATL